MAGEVTADNDDDFAPTTVVVMLGSMNFDPVQTSNILSLKISSPEDMANTLEEAAKSVRPNSLESVHVLLKSSSVSSLFDVSVLSTFYEGIIPGKEVSIHVLPESAVLAEDMPVQPNDVDSIRMGLVIAGLMLRCEQAQDGGWVLMAVKPGGDEDDDEEDEDEDEEEKELTEAEKKEEEEFRKLVEKENERDN
mmetsp:Transcript_22441/g.52975  ORF Transcript_22441/g.52975 Transcript_22441/m.52975 type:complete len:193 (+) Transcript_22441:203-781(+)